MKSYKKPIIHIFIWSFFLTLFYTKKDISVGLINFTSQDLLFIYSIGTCLNILLFYSTIYLPESSLKLKPTFLSKLILATMLLFFISTIETFVDLQFVFPERLEDLKNKFPTPFLKELTPYIVTVLMNIR